MSSKSLTIKSAWKEKIELNNIFDDTFLSEKDMALQPLEFIFGEENIINKDNHINNINSSFKDNSSENNSKDDSNLYDSNIIIISSASDDSNKQTSFNQIEKEIKKINEMIKNKKRRKKKLL